MSRKTKISGTKEDAAPTLAPKLRFQEFRDAPGWEEQAGDCLFDQINDRNPEPSLPVLAITQEHGAIPRHLIDYHVSVTEKSLESYKVVQVGDFIISLRSFQGGIEYSRYHGICSPAYVILRRRHDGGAEFFRHYLKTDRFIRILTKNLEGLRDGKMVSYAKFSEILIPVPSQPEQQKIAECLGSVDELIAAESRKLDALKTHKKGLMQQLFPCEGETQPRLRFPEFRSAKAWQRQVISSLLHKVSESMTVESDRKYREIGVRSHGKGIFHKELVSGKQIGSKRVFSVVKDAFVVNIVFAWEQAVATTSIAEEGMIASHRFPMYVALAGRCDVNYMKYFFLTNMGKHLLGLASPGGAGRNRTLGQKEFEKLEIVLPQQVDEQVRVADCLSSIDTHIAAQTQKLEALKTHKKGLMQQLFPSPKES